MSKYGPSSSTFGAFDQSTEHMMGVDDKDKNRMDTSDGMDEKVPTSFKLSILSQNPFYNLSVAQLLRSLFIFSGKQ